MEQTVISRGADVSVMAQHRAAAAAAAAVGLQTSRIGSLSARTCFLGGCLSILPTGGV